MPTSLAAVEPAEVNSSRQRSSHPSPIGLVIWSLLLTVSSDNVVKPIFMRGRADIPLALIFIGVFGGISTFGASGLILGPMLVAMLLALVRIAHAPPATPTLVPS
jgi:predicted PurR-regulated permease PerM